MEFHSKLSRAIDHINVVELQLRDVSYALRVAGNPQLANDLKNASEHLHTARLLVQGGCDDAVSESVRGAENATANMIDAVLAVSSDNGVKNG